jgi:hypothetical protein
VLEKLADDKWRVVATNDEKAATAGPEPLHIIMGALCDSIENNFFGGVSDD